MANLNLQRNQYRRRKLVSIFLTACVCALVVLAVQVPASAKDQWVKVRSKNFLLVGNASEKEIIEVGLRLEQFREVFSRLFTRVSLNSQVDTTVIIFKNDKSYRPFKPNEGTAGFFQAGPDVNYITLTTELSSSQQPYNVIFHEYTHLLINNTSRNMPTWFSEGIAEYYSTFAMTDEQRVMLGRPIASHIHLLRHKGMLPLQTLFAVDRDSPYYNERDKQSVFYAESWALVHYLILGKDGERAGQMGKFIELLASDVPVKDALQQALGVKFETLEQELRNYIQRGRYPVMSGHFERKVKYDTEVQVAPITEAEASAYLGDLLVHSRRADAEPYLKRALELEPSLPMAHASLGMWRVNQGRFAEARAHLEKAIAANSQSYLIHYHYAYVLSREGESDAHLVSGFPPENIARMREHLEKAIQLRPEFLESYSLMAFVNLVAGNRLDESIALLKRAMTFDPNRTDLVFMLAQVYLRKEDYATTRGLLERVAKSTGDAALSRRAQDLLTQVIAIEERTTAFRAAQKEQSPASTSPVLREAGGENDTMAYISTYDPAAYLREALRKPLEGETLIQGNLVRVDCDDSGITFVVKVADRFIKMNTDSFRKVKLRSFSDDAGREITCGPRKTENNVIVAYVPTNDGRSKVDGNAKSIEFVPPDFKLTPQP
ncbi:MAG TPA: DUF1570 domain-containing protein [Pyrinomonadaceae bacterium]|nr:DUF1570 domain-containing protein [Pyrinomonadaceae bacterium]